MALYSSYIRAIGVIAAIGAINIAAALGPLLGSYRQELPRRLVYRFWASRRPLFPPFRQRAQNCPFPPLRAPTGKNEPVIGYQDMDMGRGSRRPRRTQKTPLPPLKKKSSRNLREPGSKYRSRRAESNHPIHLARNGREGRYNFWFSSNKALSRAHYYSCGDHLSPHPRGVWGGNHRRGHVSLRTSSWRSIG